ncbi:hypothetical protein DFH06DRAFT_1132119 [Mycena polygramma]|nr:hypothetical protein DFH06DRAFT_1132119 [Mycena polygramma]
MAPPPVALLEEEESAVSRYGSHKGRTKECLGGRVPSKESGVSTSHRARIRTLRQHGRHSANFKVQKEHKAARRRELTISVQDSLCTYAFGVKYRSLLLPPR